jgi:DNA mismatch repair ATPase MutL
VRVQDFLSKIPVRKQSALKVTSKTITAIRKLFHAYVFARPNVRFSFKILKSKAEKDSWTFAPSKSSTNSIDVVTSVFGKDAGAQCIQKMAESDQKDKTDTPCQVEVVIIFPEAGKSALVGLTSSADSHRHSESLLSGTVLFSRRSPCHRRERPHEKFIKDV